MEEEFGGSDAPPQVWNGFIPDTVRSLSKREKNDLSGKRVLITGAGGYLGSALARALAVLPGTALLLLDQSEYGLYRLEQDLRGTEEATFCIGSVLSRSLVEEILFRFQPEIVFHAAALKHVPLMEANPFAAAETNVLGTRMLVQMSRQAGVKGFVFLSTDKAADPISIMGATKRVAEQVVLDQIDEASSDFRVARLCNVLGSTGSVAPLFVRQIAWGGPVTLTHADATRYFLSQADAVRFLLRTAVAPGRLGLLAPVVDSPLQVSALAKYLLQSMPGAASKVRIVETGLRTGDKLHEHLISSTETAELGAGEDLLKVETHFSRTKLQEALEGISEGVRARDLQRLLMALRCAVPGFQEQSVSVRAEIRA